MILWSLAARFGGHDERPGVFHDFPEDGKRVPALINLGGEKTTPAFFNSHRSQVKGRRQNLLDKQSFPTAKIGFAVPKNIPRKLSGIPLPALHLLT